MSEKTIHIDSSTRDMTQFPNACDFECILDTNFTDNNPRYYEIRLKSLILPSLNSNTKYPFLLVSLYNANVGQPIHTQSNNHNVSSELFIVPTTPVYGNYTEHISPMVQKINLKPSTTLKFSVKTPNGDILDVGAQLVTAVFSIVYVN
jgi:hypothetical protein